MGLCTAVCSALAGWTVAACSASGDDAAGSTQATAATPASEPPASARCIHLALYVCVRMASTGDPPAISLSLFLSSPTNAQLQARINELPALDRDCSRVLISGVPRRCVRRFRRQDLRALRVAHCALRAAAPEHPPCCCAVLYPAAAARPASSSTSAARPPRGGAAWCGSARRRGSSSRRRCCRTACGAAAPLWRRSQSSASLC